MKRTGVSFAVGGVVGVVLGMALVAIFLLRNPSPPCGIQRVPFDPKRPGASGLLSSDQVAVLEADGPPQAFAMYWDPHSDAILEEWSYYTLGREITFVDGAYLGGLEVPPPTLDTSAPIPSPAMYPWEIRREPSPECVVMLAGPALFRTSALVLPGWNDGSEVARLWTLAAGGSMVTVDGRLALLSIDPGEAIDAGLLGTTGLFVGTLGNGDQRMGAILTPGDKTGTYRLSLSHRGQGTTRDGTEIVLDLEGTRLDSVFHLGDNARASVVDLDGFESPVEAGGPVTIKHRNGVYDVEIAGQVGDRPLALTGRLGSGLWLATDRSLTSILGGAETLGAQVASVSWPTPTAAPEATPTATPESRAGSPPEAPPGWRVLLWEPFDSNANQWPSGDFSGEHSTWNLQFTEGQYSLQVRRNADAPSVNVSSRINLDIGPQFYISAEVTPTGGDAQACGLRITGRDGAPDTFFCASDTHGTFEVFHTDASGSRRNLIASTKSPAIRLGEANRLTVVGDEAGFTFLINGQLVGAADVGRVDVQRVGVMARILTSEPVLCSFDSVEVRVP